MEEAKTDITYCLKNCDKDCWRKASNYKFVEIDYTVLQMNV